MVIKIYILNGLSQYKLNFQILDETVEDKSSPHHKDNNKIPECINDILYFRIKNATFDRDLFVFNLLVKKIYNV